jgi:non-specific serine/threonine protein kinase
MLDLLDVEWANVEAALDFCGGSSAGAGPGLPELGLRMAADLWLYWAIRGRYQIGRRHLETFLTLARAPTATRAMALWALGFLAEAPGDHDAALASLEEARRVSEQTGGERELAYALFGLAAVRLRLGETELASELLAASWEAMTGVDDAFGRAMCLYCYATAMAAAGRSVEARRLALEGLDATDRAADKFGEGNLDTLLGTLEWLAGDPQAAEARMKEAVRIQDRIGHRWGMVMSLEGLAWAAGSSGRPERAALLLGASAALCDQLGNQYLLYEQAYHDSCEAAALAALGEDRYRACWQEGYALSQGQAVAAALEDEGTVPAARPVPAAAAADGAFELSARELEVARLVADGLSNPAIASALFVSVATIKTHVSHILAKLGLDSRTQLGRWVADHDLGPAAPARR